MKRIVVIKPFTNQFVAHVYEHMVASSIMRTFRKRGLLPYIDYMLDAKTYYKGAVWLEVYLYSDEAKAIGEDILKLDVDVSQESIDTALLQISAEKSLEFMHVDYKLLRKDLRVLYSTAWQYMRDGLMLLNQEDMPLDYAGVTYRRLKPRKKLTFEQSIVLTCPSADGSEEERFVQAVALVLTHILQASLQEDVANSLRCYSADSRDYDSTRSIVFANKFFILKEAGVDSHALESLASGTLRIFEDPHFIQRLARLDIDDEDTVPALTLMLEYLGMSVSARYWRRAINSGVVRDAIRLLSVR